MNQCQRQRSIVEYFEGHEKYRCGYCGGKDTNYSHGLWAHSMTVQDYHDLIDRGWRRSGKYCYKPTMDQTCCPHYTIRCEALNFTMSRSQKKVIKKVNRYLNTGIRSPEADDGQGHGETGHDLMEQGSRSETKVKDIDISEGQSSSGQSDASVGPSELKPDAGVDIPPAVDDDKGSSSKTTECPAKPQPSEKAKKPPRPGQGADPSKPQCQKAKLRRLERKHQKQASRGGLPTDTQDATKKHKNKNEAKTMEDFLNDIVADPVHKLEVRLVRSSPRSRLFDDSFEEVYAIYKRYQMTVHNDPPDKPTERQFTRFLVDSPLQEKYTEGGLREGYGSFHQHYILDGKIIAVGVIDILPRCTSSVYLFYDPDYAFLCPGTYSAIREAAFTRYLHSVEANIEYYYMGFYIHSCPKMVYKGQYTPSFILCPEVYSWHPIEECRPKMDASRYSRFAAADKEDENGRIDLAKVLVLYTRQAMPYAIYRALAPEAEDEEAITQYSGFVGKKCAERMLLYRSSDD